MARYLLGGGKPIRVSPPGPELKVGDFIDSWKVIRCEENQFLSLFFGMKGPGLGRLEITIKDDGEEREFDISRMVAPTRLSGLTLLVCDDARAPIYL